MYSLEILVGGKPIHLYYHEGNTFAEGREGSEFTLRLTNRSSSRVLMIPSVDGLSVFTGKTADSNSRGYVVGANQSIVIPGWTLDNQSVAKFFFTNKKDAYARTGGSTGVLGLLVYGELVQQPVNILPKYTWDKNINSTPYHNPPLYRSINQISTQASMISGSSNGMELGTGFGEKTDFATTSTSFNRGPQLALKSIYYDSRKNLEARGIKIYSDKPLPRPFSDIGCTPPPNWRG